MALQLRRTLVQSIMLCIFFFTNSNSVAQLLQHKNNFTYADTLRGSLNENRNWWNVTYYNITIHPNITNKELEGKVEILFTTKINGNKLLQLDLQQPLIIDSCFFNNQKISFQKQHQNTWLCNINNIEAKQYIDKIKGGKGWINKQQQLLIYYHGKPKQAINPPWDGGWIWKKDKNGNPFVSVAVQGLGASAWYPCKDHQSDEPDNGASLTIIVPDSLVAIANGNLISKNEITISKETSFTWQVKNPINNYCIIPYIGKYVNFSDTLMGEKGKLNINYWVLNYNLEKAKEQFKQVKPMLHAFEDWFGPYPFYEDGYQLIDAPHLGMEHQSAVAYGNQYKNGYLGMDRSASGWGKKWDFIIIHESGHEWFANNITTKDIADMWVHEGFTTYSETLFTEYYFGKQAGNEYNYGQRKNIRNDENIIGTYGVNKEGSGDQYDKASNMLHSIRHAINNDVKFKNMLRGLNATFYHQTVTTQQIEKYISKNLGFNFNTVFNQYLRTTQLPILEYYFADNHQTLWYRYNNCINNFNLPITLENTTNATTLYPNTNWKSTTTLANAIVQQYFQNKGLEKLYYIVLKEIKQ